MEALMIFDLEPFRVGIKLCGAPSSKYPAAGTSLFALCDQW
jgi:hypothetical protein